ncbi:DUF805 domain-containing protein [Agreia bicolorata]|uniref:DUF805 domain-containing protein n=1 Tax=Agreia bicolorata TaxID=110935 RepID=UPI000696B84E|nr:DUF805 domain-containing protein [Agreia bicolorata]
MSFTTTPPRMSFGAAISTGFRKYADFAGRAGVAEFWWFILFIVLVNASAQVLDGMLPVPVHSLGWTHWRGYGSSDGPLTTLWALGTLVPVLAVAVRRLRDGGNRWTQLFWLLLPIVGLILTAIRMCDPSKPEVSNQDAPVI